jgi:hypothetical protein
MRSFLSAARGIILILITFSLLALPAAAVSAVDNQDDTIISININEVEIIVDETIKGLGYLVNGKEYSGPVCVFSGDNVVVSLKTYPYHGTLSSVVEGSADQILGDYSVLLYNIRSTHVTLRLTLSGVPSNPVIPPTPDNPPSGDGPDYPNVPDYPDTPDTPSKPENPPTDEPGTDEPTKPDNPPVNPDTPGSDEPGSDDPYRPILPPAGSVYNIAGFIPIGAGALLLFLVFFWRRKVYRILKSHAKKHGEKPEKEHLKEIADAIIKLVRDEGRYPKWKKNNDVMRRLGVGICELLDEMNYPKIVPREALATEILKAARGRINRHRL